MSYATSYRAERAPAGAAERTPQGFLRVPGNLTRVGVLEYERADGTVVRELRPHEEVFRTESLESLRFAPVTDGHPSTGRVSPSNVRDVAVGHVAGVQRDGDHVAGAVQLQAAGVLERVERGEGGRELSAGYTCRVEETPGVWNGQPYDAVQRDIVYDHVALVDVGRAGPSVALRLDAFRAVTPDCAVERRADGGGPIVKRKLQTAQEVRRDARRRAAELGRRPLGDPEDEARSDAAPEARISSAAEAKAHALRRVRELGRRGLG